MAEQSVTLQPGESTPVAFEAIPSEAKTYQVSVDGLTGSFRAVAVAATANLWGVVYAGKKEIYIADAKVTIDGVTTYTNASGNYGFEEFFGTAVPPGTYTLTVTKEGYQTFETDITLREGANFLDIQLLPIQLGECNILRITIHTSPPVVGKRVALSVSLTNQSGVASSYHLDIYVDGLRILSWGGTLLYGQGTNIGADFTPIRAGVHTAKADLDYGREVLTKDFEVFPA